MKISLNKLEEKIKEIVPNIPIKKVYIKSANKTFLCACVEGATCSIRLYDEDCGLDHVASIDYRPTAQSCFISAFETKEHFQRLGLGRFIYNMALAHADMLGVTYSYGIIEPTNNIKDVSKFYKDCREEEIEALKEIYEHLGNNIEPAQNGESLKLFSNWKSGERIKLLNKAQKELLKEFVIITKVYGVGV